MEHCVELYLDEALLKRAYLPFARDYLKFAIGCFAEMLAPFAVLSVIGFLIGGVWRYIALEIFLIGVCFASWNSWMAWRAPHDKIKRAWQVYSQMSQPVYRFYFSEEGVRIETEINSSQLSWKAFQRLTHFPDIWQLFTDESICWILPVTQMSLETQQLIERKCREHKIPVT